MEKTQLYIGLILLGSFLEMWNAAAICDIMSKNRKKYGAGDNYDDCDDEYAFAVAVGVIGLAFSICMLLLQRFAPSIAEGIVGQICICLMWALWFCAMAICTFQKPFAPGPAQLGQGDYAKGTYGNSAGNGYFSTWLCLAASTMLMATGVPFIKGLFEKLMGAIDDEKKFLILIGFASMIVMWHASRVCDQIPDDTPYNSYSCNGMLGWGIAAPVISLVICLVVGILGNFVTAIAGMVKWVAIFLAIWWACAVLSLTMPNSSDIDVHDDIYAQGLFVTISNGFAGCWVAMLASVYLSAIAFGVAEGPGSSGGGGGEEEGHDGKHASEMSNPTADHHDVHVEETPAGSNNEGTC